MAETTVPVLSGVAETLLITLYLRAMESQRPDALISDEQAEALCTRSMPWKPNLMPVSLSRVRV